MKCISKEDFWEKMTLKKWRYFLKIYDFWQKKCFLLKNTTFELLDHHHELNQKKLILKEFFMFKIDSSMLKLWSIPFFFLYISLISDIFEKNDFGKMTLFLKIYDLNKKYWFLIKYVSFELWDHHHDLNQKKLILKEFLCSNLIVLC